MNFSTPLEEIHTVYGENAVLSQINGYNIIHLDNPTDAQIKERIQDVRNNGIIFEKDTPFFEALKNKPCDIVYFPKNLTL